MRSWWPSRLKPSETGCSAANSSRTPRRAKAWEATRISRSAGHPSVIKAPRLAEGPGSFSGRAWQDTRTLPPGQGPEEYVGGAALSSRVTWFREPKNGIEALELLSNRKAAATVTLKSRMELGIWLEISRFRSAAGESTFGAGFRAGSLRRSTGLSARYLGFTLGGDLTEPLNCIDAPSTLWGAMAFSGCNTGWPGVESSWRMVSTPTGGKDIAF